MRLQLLHCHRHLQCMHQSSHFLMYCQISCLEVSSAAANDHLTKSRHYREVGLLQHNRRALSCSVHALQCDSHIVQGLQQQVKILRRSLPGMLLDCHYKAGVMLYGLTRSAEGCRRHQKECKQAYQSTTILLKHALLNSGKSSFAKGPPVCQATLLNPCISTHVLEYRRVLQ